MQGSRDQSRVPTLPVRKASKARSQRLGSEEQMEKSERRRNYKQHTTNKQRNARDKTEYQSQTVNTFSFLLCVPGYVCEGTFTLASCSSIPPHLLFLRQRVSLYPSHANWLHQLVSELWGSTLLCPPCPNKTCFYMGDSAPIQVLMLAQQIRQPRSQLLGPVF